MRFLDSSLCVDFDTSWTDTMLHNYISNQVIYYLNNNATYYNTNIDSLIIIVEEVIKNVSYPSLPSLIDLHQLFNDLVYNKLAYDSDSIYVNRIINLLFTKDVSMNSIGDSLYQIKSELGNKEWIDGDLFLPITLSIAIHSWESVYSGWQFNPVYHTSSTDEFGPGQPGAPGSIHPEVIAADLKGAWEGIKLVANVAAAAAPIGSSSGGGAAYRLGPRWLPLGAVGAAIIIGGAVGGACQRSGEMSAKIQNDLQKTGSSNLVYPRN